MSWRTSLGVLLGFLLPAPLVWVLYTVEYGGAQQAPDPRMVPMLSVGERQGLLTYGHKCQRSQECSPPLVCLFNTRFMASYCTDSRCLTDQDCSEGFACQTHPARDGVFLVRLCTLVGVRKEGELCLPSSDTREYGCGPGLVCQEGLCGRPCRLDEPASCPEGFFCRESRTGASCLPTCDERSCPEGRQCVRLNESASACVVVHGENCQRTPCAEGLHCWPLERPERPGEVWMRCASACGRDNPPCPEGLVCHRNTCEKPCDPEVPGVCGPDFKCHRDSEREPWTCQPDF